MPLRIVTPAAAALLLFPPLLSGQAVDLLVAPYPPEQCSSCAGWNEPARPFHIHGGTYFVGTRGLNSLLITSSEGHVLLDGGLPDSAPLIMANVRALGFDVGDIRMILNSHAHFDHAGGIAAIQRASGARVVATPPSVPVLESGRAGPDDPQFGTAFDFPPVASVESVLDGGSVRVGEVRLTAHLTAGHTPGGTTWTWRSCEGNRCLDIVYADSQTPISRDGFLYSRNDRYPDAIRDFERGFATLESLSCDILVTPHAGSVALWERVANGPEGLVDPAACRRYAATAREQLRSRLETERGQR
jgi:metallo-beta-lactamase class B